MCKRAIVSNREDLQRGIRYPICDYTINEDEKIAKLYFYAKTSDGGSRLVDEIEFEVTKTEPTINYLRIDGSLNDEHIHYYLFYTDLPDNSIVIRRSAENLLKGDRK